MPINEPLQTDRTTKVYNLAVKMQSKSNETLLLNNQPNNQHNCMQLIAEQLQQADQNNEIINNTAQNVNIFAEKSKQLTDLRQIQQHKSIIGRKEFMAYKVRLDHLRSGKTRHKLSESHMPFLKIQLAKNNKSEIGVIGKEQLLQLQNSLQLTHQHRNNVKLQLNKTDQSVEQTDSRQKGLKNYSLKKLKLQHRYYTASWENYATKTNKMNRDTIDIHRKKIEKLAQFTLRQRKENISPRLWDANLRQKCTLANIHNRKFTEKIERESDIKVVGEGKLAKELGWLKFNDAGQYLPTEDFKNAVQKKRQWLGVSIEASDGCSTGSQSFTSQMKTMHNKKGKISYDIGF